MSVGDTGIEPVTSSVSGKRATAAPIAPKPHNVEPGFSPRWVRDSNPCIRLCRPLPRLSANPPCRRFPFRQCPASGRRDSNSRHPPWQGGALPAELRPQKVFRPCPCRGNGRFPTKKNSIGRRGLCSNPAAFSASGIPIGVPFEHGLEFLSVAERKGDWRSGSALRSHRRGHWFEPSIAHPCTPG